ncbi:hypothetical protein EXIGLDRAFT_709477 [Exidia glandulosa HHB12029]|uniref:Aminoacyl-transfer RNA synthetases class-II family profile domain-containing protein n=1 Tax=Exidia glandulosa HHB12029 TaxID=1314781 RepID=A0A165QQV3_EXIGL|nr:hypothetical protein EXIGLDRAFT_709477 [Exidia glandulosa HHB12029]
MADGECKRDGSPHVGHGAREHAHERGEDVARLLVARSELERAHMLGKACVTRKREHSALSGAGEHDMSVELTLGDVGESARGERERDEVAGPDEGADDVDRLYGSHHCAQLSAADAGKQVLLAGWILPERPVSKSFSFFPLKDANGSTQLVAFKPKKDAPENTRNVLAELSQVPVESTVLIEGEVVLRPQNAVRPEPAGDIEVHVRDFTLLNPALREHMPFIPSSHTGDNLPNEELRLKHRYLDLRRPQLAANIRKRSQVAHVVRNFLHECDFVEVETPVLLQSSPEGAREFLVPSRTSSSDDEPRFYALSQSPQQPKQLLVCSGAVDRYFQLARCFRDEDGRRDRQPEFTQIDLEMAFVSWRPPQSERDNSGWRVGGSEIRDVVQNMLRTVFALDGIALPELFPVLRYQEAMAKYGSDKPDTRFRLQIQDVTVLLPEAERAAAAEADSARTRRSHKHNSLCKPTSSAHLTCALAETLKLEPGDTIWISTRPRVATAAEREGALCGRIACLIGLWTPPREPALLWVTEFPLFTRADEDKDLLAHGRWSSSHHPFTAPMVEDLPLLASGDFAKIRGQHFDLVLNGYEIGGGSVRVHDPQMQERILRDVLELSDTECATFAHLLAALRSGAPPHGGMALGFDRFMAILCNTRSIRDVIAFPKTAGGADLLFNSPSPVAREVLKQYGL